MAYSKELGEPTILDVSNAKAIMQGLVDAAKEKEGGAAALDAKTVKGCVHTSGRKVMACRFPHAKPSLVAASYTFIVTHAKEPKSDVAAEVLARFYHELALSTVAP